MKVEQMHPIHIEGLVLIYSFDGSGRAIVAEIIP